MVIEEKRINTKLIITGLIIGMFFSALEQTIVGTAMPTIISELNGFTIFAWVTTAYMITSTTVVPIVGKLSHNEPDTQKTAGRIMAVAGAHRR